MVLLEASGGLEMSLVAALAVVGLPVVVVTPRQIRDLARATAKLTKTNSLDAEFPAHFAGTIQPPMQPLGNIET